MPELFPYQQKDLIFLQEWGRCANWSQPGLGKTAVALRWLPKLPALVVAPTVVLSHWVEEVALWRPDIRPALYLGPAAKRHRMLEQDSEWDLLLTSYETFRNDVDLLVAEGFATVIFDEAHKLKNPKAKVTKAAEKLTADPNCCVQLMTGTPIVSGYMDMFSYMHLLFPGQFKSYWKFARQYGHVYQDTFGMTPKETEVGRRRLQRLLSQFSVRHTKQEVLPNLPPKLTTTLTVDLSPAHRTLYTQMEVEALLELENRQEEHVPDILAKIMYLRQLALDPTLIGEPALPDLPAKTKALLELLEDRRGFKVVIASQFKRYLQLIAPLLKEQGFHPVLITGDQSTKEKDAAVEAFQQGNADVALISIRAAGVGINLHAADTIIFTDRDWSAAANEQCEDRLHRVGQQNNVSIIILEAKNTMDNRIRAVNRVKEYSAKALLDIKQIV